MNLNISVWKLDIGWLQICDHGPQTVAYLEFQKGVPSFWNFDAILHLYLFTERVNVTFEYEFINSSVILPSDAWTYSAHRRLLANVNLSYMLSPVRLSVVRLSVVCLSVVCNARAPYSWGWIFRQCFYAIGALAIHWHPWKILWRAIFIFYVIKFER